MTKSMRLFIGHRFNRRLFIVLLIVPKLLFASGVKELSKELISSDFNLANTACGYSITDTVEIEGYHVIVTDLDTSVSISGNIYVSVNVNIKYPLLPKGTLSYNNLHYSFILSNDLVIRLEGFVFNQASFIKYTIGQKEIKSELNMMICHITLLNNKSSKKYIKLIEKGRYGKLKKYSTSNILSLYERQYSFVVDPTVIQRAWKF